MLGDWMLNGISTAMVRGATDRVASAGSAQASLAAIGITTGSDGRLSIDSARLSAALQAGPTAVASLFGASDGIATRLHARIDYLLASDGAIAARNLNLSDAQKRISVDSHRLDDQMAVVQQRYLAQFTALDSLMAQLQSTSNYLTQQLANVSSMINDYNSK
jgi:flagellar hook-associated protein 2